jgi:hypothetical protein
LLVLDPDRSGHVSFSAKVRFQSIVQMEKPMRIVTKAIGPVDAVATPENPKTLDAFWSALPIKGKANRWDGEIYFS